MTTKLDPKNALQPSRRATEVPPSPIRAIFQTVVDMEEAGANDIIKLHIGDPDFGAPETANKATADAVIAGHTHYSPTAGLSKLRRALAVWLNKEMDAAFSWDHIVCTIGACQALNSAIIALLQPGDEILFPESYWPNYVQMSIVNTVEARLFPLDDNYLPDLKGLEEMIIPGKTKAILTCTPSNPTGAVYTKEHIKGIYDIACKYNLAIISDEAYMHFKFAPYETITFASLEKSIPCEERRVVTIGTFSKSYAMTGYRIGYVAAPNVNFARLIQRLSEPQVGSLTTFHQYGAIEALKDTEYPLYMAKRFMERRDKAYEVLAKYGRARYKPHGAFYIMVDISDTNMDSDSFALALLKEKHVSTAPGSGFGLIPQYGQNGEVTFKNTPRSLREVRISFCGDDDELVHGLTKLCEFAEELKNKHI